jgi:hypothetical protein
MYILECSSCPDFMISVNRYGRGISCYAAPPATRLASRENAYWGKYQILSSRSWQKACWILSLGIRPLGAEDGEYCMTPGLGIRVLLKKIECTV